MNPAAACLACRRAAPLAGGDYCGPCAAIVAAARARRDARPPRPRAPRPTTPRGVDAIRLRNPRRHMPKGQG